MKMSTFYTRTFQNDANKNIFNDNKLLSIILMVISVYKKLLQIYLRYVQ